MHLEISGRLLSRNAWLNFVSQAGPLLVAVATIPFIVKGLGVERFGLLSIAWIAPEFFTFIDLGLGRAITKYVAVALGKGDRDRVCGLVWTAMTFQAVLGCFGSLVLIGMTTFLTEQLLNIPAALEPEAKDLFRLTALSIPLVLVSTSLTGLLGAGQRFDLLSSVNATFHITNIVITLVGVLIFNWGLPEIAAFVLAARFVVLLAYYRLCIYVYSFFRKPRFYFSGLPNLLAFGGWVTVSGVVVPALLYMDRFVIGASMTMAAVAYYSIPFEIVARLWTVPTSLAATLFPALSMLSGQQEQVQRLSSLLCGSMKWMILILGAAVLMITAFAHDILELWLGSSFAQESALVLQILAVGILINSAVQVQYAFLQALGRPDLTAKFHLIQLPLHGLVLWCLVSSWGIPGAALAQSIRLSVEALLLLFGTCHLTSLSFHWLRSEKIVQTFLLLLFVAVFTIAISKLPLVMWLRLVGLGIVFCAVGRAVWRYSLNRQDRDHLLEFFWPASAR